MRDYAEVRGTGTVDHVTARDGLAMFGVDDLGLDRLDRAVRLHAESGGAVVLATHDVELAARCATRAVVLGDGEIVAEGDARQVLAGSLFAPQVLRVLPPFLTVEEVERAGATR